MALPMVEENYKTMMDSIINEVVAEIDEQILKDFQILVPEKEEKITYIKNKLKITYSSLL